MLQQPLPPHLSIREIADAIPAHKDVDGTHPMNQGHLAFGSGTEYVPATPAAVMLLLERSPHWPLRGRRAVMIGRSIVVGAPVAMLMLAQDATVTVLHKETREMRRDVKNAEIVVVATGVPGLITGDDIMPGATVIDVGTTVVDGVLKGDVDFESAVKVAGAITPVPGGVGPVTNVALLRNVVKSAEKMGLSASLALTAASSVRSTFRRTSLGRGGTRGLRRFRSRSRNSTAATFEQPAQLRQQALEEVVLGAQARLRVENSSKRCLTRSAT